MTLKEFVQKHRLDFIRHQYDNIYGDANNEIPQDYTFVGQLTDLLRASGIDVFKWLDYVPSNFMGYSNYSGGFIVPENVQNILPFAFYHCKNITSIFVKGNVKLVSDYAFNSCKKLEKIYLPASVAVFGEEVFTDCPDLTTIEYGGTKEQWKQIAKPQGRKQLFDMFDPERKIHGINCSDGWYPL